MKQKLLLLKKILAYVTVSTYVISPGVANIPDKIANGYYVEENALNNKVPTYKKRHK